MQLFGYHLILNINDHVSEKTHNVTDSEVEVAINNSLFAYEQRALKPLLDELPKREKAYLLTVSECLDSNRLANTSDIANKLESTSNNLSRQRAYLIDHGIIASPEREKIMFCIPYLADYVKKEDEVSDVIMVARSRRV